jgi:hypothetical protein
MSQRDEPRGPDAATATDPAAPPASVALVGDHRLRLTRSQDEDVLRVEAPDGRLCVSVVVTPEGTRIELEGAELAIRSSGGVAIDAEHVSLTGREGLSLATERDLEIRAGGVIRTEGHAQHLVSRRGDLTVYANDDVKIAAERIKMNC